QEQRMWMNELDSSKVKPMNGLLLQGVEDMAKMTELNQASILCNLNTRYHQDEIYTYIGSILISVNPYKRLHELYDEKTLARYTDKDLGAEPPHVYAISNECYSCMWKREENQCVLIRWAIYVRRVDTINNKPLLNHSTLSVIFECCITNESRGENGRSIEKSILESGPILEALGNAKTVYNNNSSRFGKFIQLLISQAGQIQGGRITDCILANLSVSAMFNCHRVVRQNPGERNYHIFYQLIRGVKAEDRDRLFLMEPEEYHYLNQSGCCSDPTLNDSEDWNMLEQALQVIGFKEGQKQDMMSVLSGILQLGNVAFVNAGGAQVVDTDVIDRTSQLLGIDNERLEAVMKERTMKLRGENITSPQSIDQHFIESILIFDLNQPNNINLTMAMFNSHLMYSVSFREGIDWCDVEWADNSECLDLVEKNLGLMSLINEESRFPKGTDKSLLNKLHNQHAKNPFYVKPRVTGSEFGIRHYAGEVCTKVGSLVELSLSSCDLIYDLFEKVRGNAADSGKGRSKQVPTASGQFKYNLVFFLQKSLHSLMERLSSANPFFVRCVKPNILKVPDNFNASIVLNQLRYSGMLETVRVRKAGFPVRRLYKDFWERNKQFTQRNNLTVDIEIFFLYIARYCVVCPNAGDLPEPRDRAKAALNQVDREGGLWRLGETKVFMKEILEQMLEKVRAEKVYGSAVIVQSVVRAYAARKYFLKLKACSIHAQRFVRGFIARRRFHKACAAILRIQKMERGRQARKLFAVMIFEKREQDRLRNSAALVLLEKHRQLKALKEQMERERREREEQRQRLEREELERQQRELEEKLSAMANLDAVIDAAAFDSAYSTANKRTFSEQDDYLEEQEKLEMDRILQLELEISQMHRRSEARASVISMSMENLISWREELAILLLLSFEQRNSGLMENIDVELAQNAQEVFPDKEKADETRGMDILQDLGFEELESQMETMTGGSAFEETAIEDIVRTIFVAFICHEFSVLNEPFVICRIRSRGMITKTVGMLMCSPQAPLILKMVRNRFSSLAYTMDPKSAWCFGSRIISSEFILFSSYASANHKLNKNRIPMHQFHSESYYTDSSFDDDDLSDTDTNASGQDQTERWNPNVYFHSYLDMKGGLMSQWKRRWCVISNSTFMFFRSKQDSLKCGWLLKKSDSGKGTLRGTLPRKHWQRKWVALRNHEMKIYDNDDENAKCKMTIDLSTITDVTDVTEKENGIDVIMSNKAHHFAAESTEEANEWYSILMKILSSSEQEIASMESEFANPKNAIGSIDGQTITAVTATTVSGKSNTFSITTSQRAYVLACDGVEEMHHWITLLNESMNSANSADSSSAVQQGWMMRSFVERQRVTHQRRWFVLKPNVIEYYKSSDRGAQKLGSMGLNNGHYTLRDSAIRFFDRLLLMEEQSYTSIEQEASIIQELLRICHGSKAFQDEVYLQLIKQTAHVTTCPHYWHLIACMCCAYHPSRPVMQYLKFHLKRTKERYPETPGGIYAAFAEKAVNLQTSRRREMVPSIPEICAALERRDLVTVIKCYGGATCDIYIDSFTTAGQVVQKLRRGMQLEGNRNTFALFEKKGTEERALEPATFLSDVLAKFEALNQESGVESGELEWELYFKLYCVFDPMEVKEDSIEYHFVFEDVKLNNARVITQGPKVYYSTHQTHKVCSLMVHEQVIHGLYPANEDILRELAALRLQFVMGNYTQLDWVADLDKYYPVSKVREAYEITSNVDFKEKRSGSFGSNLSDTNTISKKRSSSIFHTLRKKGMKKVKEADEENVEMKKTLYQEELQDVRSNVADRWRKLRGMQPEEAVVEYVSLARTWPGYGSYLFKVENNEAQFGESRLSLAVASKGVTVYKRGHAAALDHFSFENILSFGATSATVFRLQTGSRGDLTFNADEVTEIVKLMRAYVQALYKR
uniref:Unconventional myosin-X n=1 Tax=Ciona savignyi TaxID=51511 RepID=H2ZET4_CIOSA